MKRLTKQRLQKEVDNALSRIDDYWNDWEIVCDFRHEPSVYTTHIDDAMYEWKESNAEYKRIAVRLNNMDEFGDIIDIEQTFEYEVGI